MTKRIIVNVDVDYWSDEVRKSLMRFLVHNCKVVDDNDKSDFQGVIIEPLKPYPLIPIDNSQEKSFDIEW